MKLFFFYSSRNPSLPSCTSDIIMSNISSYFSSRLSICSCHEFYILQKCHLCGGADVSPPTVGVGPWGVQDSLLGAGVSALGPPSWGPLAQWWDSRLGPCGSSWVRLRPLGPSMLSAWVGNGAVTVCTLSPELHSVSNFPTCTHTCMCMQESKTSTQTHICIQTRTHKQAFTKRIC